MISLVITTKTNAENPVAKAETISKLLNKTGEDWEVVIVARESHPQIEIFKAIALTMPNHTVVALNAGASDNCLVFAGFNATQEGDILIAEADTSIGAIEQLLIMRTKKSEFVQVNEKENFFFRFFSWMGEIVYNMGLKINGKTRDHLCSQDVQLVDGRVVDIICENPDFMQQIRADPDFENLKVEKVKIRDLSTPKRKQIETAPARALGAVGLIYLIALLALAVVYPATHGGQYSGLGWLVFLALALWIGLGFVLVSYLARQMYSLRVGTKVIDDRDQPMFSVVDIIYYQEPEQEPIQVPEVSLKQTIKAVKQKTGTQTKTTADKKTKPAATQKTVAKASSGSSNAKAKSTQKPSTSTKNEKR